MSQRIRKSVPGAGNVGLARLPGHDGRPVEFVQRRITITICVATNQWRRDWKHDCELAAKRGTWKASLVAGSELGDMVSYSIQGIHQNLMRLLWCRFHKRGYIKSWNDCEATVPHGNSTIARDKSQKWREISSLAEESKGIGASEKTELGQGPEAPNGLPRSHTEEMPNTIQMRIDNFGFPINAKKEKDIEEWLKAVK